MYNKRQPTFTGIPERNETDAELMLKKWVPKKKYDLLKAKYKCLKKLFQIYDASVIGILPELPEAEDKDRVRKKRKRSHRTKTEAYSGTGEFCSDNILSYSESNSIATSIIKEFNLNHSCSSTQTVDNKTIKRQDAECQCDILDPPIFPNVIVNKKQKLSKFQCFFQRLCGVRKGNCRRKCIMPNGHYAAGDSNFYSSLWEKKRRRGVRYRRLRRPKKINLEGAIKDMRSSVILTYMQSVHRSCLMDATQRQCPIAGCRLMFYGIINYNDHINLCHFTERKFFCLYCHEGFENEYHKLCHEYEHIGINKLTANFSIPSTRCWNKTDAIIQTDPDVKIVSFFDKISDKKQVFAEVKNKRCLKSKLHQPLKAQSESSYISSGERTISSVYLPRRMQKGNVSNAADLKITSAQTRGRYGPAIACCLCGEHFNCRRNLSLHVDLEHRVQDKFSNFYSYAGLVNYRPSKRVAKGSSERKIKANTLDQSSSISEELAKRVSKESLDCDPSTNIIYYTSQESITTPRIRQAVQGMKIPPCYKWEPGTVIIRV